MEYSKTVQSIVNLGSHSLSNDHRMITYMMIAWNQNVMKIAATTGTKQKKRLLLLTTDLNVFMCKCKYTLIEISVVLKMKVVFFN